MSSNIEISKICEFCGKEFIARKTITKCCSASCTKKAYKARMRQSKIEKVQNETEKIKNKDINEVQSKDYLSVADVCLLIGISRRTIYRMIGRNELQAGKFGKRTIIRRADIDSIFTQPVTKSDESAQPDQLRVTEWIGLSEVQEKYKVSPKALSDIIKRNNVPKLQEGIFVFVSKNHIDNILNPLKK
jgi:excisionase family DNA binding protein